MKRRFTFCIAIISVVLLVSLNANQSNAWDQVVISDSTYSLSGTIVNAETDEAISNAIIDVRDSEMNTTTDDSGSFTLQGLVQGTYTLKVSAEGYRDYEVKLNVGDNLQKVVIKLTPEQTDDNK